MEKCHQDFLLVRESGRVSDLLQAGGALIGPHALGVIKDVDAVRHLAELGVVFLLFNIGLELSLERLRQMQKYVFGLGSAQVLMLPFEFL